MQEQKQKRFIVRKYVMAKSALEAIKKEKSATVDEVWVDDKWLDEATKHEIGFKKR